MKFEACPVEPPGLGSGPLSSSTRSRQPSSARWWATLFPTMPAPITTALARLGKLELMNAFSSQIAADGQLYRAPRAGSQEPSQLAVEADDVAARDAPGGLRIARADRPQELAVLRDGVAQPGRPVEHEEPHPQRAVVVAAQILLDRKSTRLNSSHSSI